ncbi:MAG TPA: helix-turn-helix transcriptional regulator [Pirellulales bacterium]|nr:helix-turn-helix transcriptional regulator [Pirellulales bacterium]
MMAMIDLTNVQTLTLAGERFVILPEAEFVRLTGELPEPHLPPANDRGNYPAHERTRAIMARDIIRSRRALGWSRAELARRAGIRAETLNLIEQAQRSPSTSTYDKVHRALETGEAEQARSERGKAKRAKVKSPQGT